MNDLCVEKIRTGKDISFLGYLKRCIKDFVGEPQRSYEYWSDCLDKMKKQLNEAENWDEETASLEAKYFYNRLTLEEYYNNSIPDIKLTYIKILCGVEEWVPPETHKDLSENLRQSMKERIKEAIRIEEGKGNYQEPEVLSGPEFKKQKIKNAKEGVKLAEIEMARYLKIIEWIKVLRKADMAN